MFDWNAAIRLGVPKMALFIILYVSSIFFHESGHYLYYWWTAKEKPVLHLRRKKKRFPSLLPNMEFAIKQGRLNQDEFVGMAWAGVLLGLIPAMLFIEHLGILLTFVWAAMYLYGCRNDLEIIGDS